MSIGSEGRSLELYFINGNPDGMLTAEVFNWTGHILMTPRTQIAAALSRKEARHTGVYILLGNENDKPYAYIGEGESIGERIKTHDTSLDWWDRAVFVTTSANNLNKAHVKYLEARLIEEAKTVGRVTLKNASTPARPGLSEAAQSNMEVFLDYLLMALPALRIDMFLAHAKATLPAWMLSNTPTFELVIGKDGQTATARLIEEEFIVEAGSKARLAWKHAASAEDGYAKLRRHLIETGILKQEGDHFAFTTNYSFSSPSAAAAVVLGRHANGRTEWRVKGTDRDYASWEAGQLAVTYSGVQ